MTDYDYKSKGKLEVSHQTVYVYWYCDHCGNEAYRAEIPMYRLTGGIAEKAGGSTEVLNRKGNYAVSSIVRSLMYPVRRYLPSFLQGFVADVEQKVTTKTHTAAAKAALTDQQEAEALDMAWNQAKGGMGQVNAFHGEIRCDKCINA